MSKRTVVVFIMFALFAAFGFVVAQESTRGSAGGRDLQGGPPRFGPMGGPMGEWFENLTKAYEQKDMEKIGQLIEEMKQRRQGFEGRMRGGGPGGGPQGPRGFGGFGPSGPQTGSQSAFDSPSAPKTDAEKKILAVLEEMDKDRGRRFASVSPNDGRLLRQLTEAVGAKRVIEIGTSTGYSGLWFAMALRSTGGKLITHEIDTVRASMARENFKKAGVDDLITNIDYLNKLLSLVRPGGLIVAHNMNPRQADPDYVKAITTNPDLETLLLLREEAGISVTLKKR